RLRIAKNRWIEAEAEAELVPIALRAKLDRNARLSARRGAGLTYARHAIARRRIARAILREGEGLTGDGQRSGSGASGVVRPHPISDRAGAAARGGRKDSDETGVARGVPIAACAGRHIHG